MLLWSNKNASIINSQEKSLSTKWSKWDSEIFLGWKEYKRKNSWISPKKVSLSWKNLNSILPVKPGGKRRNLKRISAQMCSRDSISTICRRSKNGKNIYKDANSKKLLSLPESVRPRGTLWRKVCQEGPW